MTIDRICPVQTFALDFCKKIYGARSYQGLTAEQVLSGWVFYGNTWANEPFIKIKSDIRENYIIREPMKAYAYFALFQAIGSRLIFNPRENREDIKMFAAVAHVDHSLAKLHCGRDYGQVFRAHHVACLRQEAFTE